MIQLFHWMGAALLPLCGWLTGAALQAGKEQHILQLQRTVELLQRIRQEIAYRRLDLEQLQRCLVQEKLLEGLRGKGGGYRLTRKPPEYTLGEILRLTEGSLAPVACVEEHGSECPNRSVCPTLPVWQKLDALINEFLDGITLADLMTPQNTEEDS